MQQLAREHGGHSRGEATVPQALGTRQVEVGGLAVAAAAPCGGGRAAGRTLRRRRLRHWALLQLRAALWRPPPGLEVVAPCTPLAREAAVAGATPTKSRGHREVGKYYVPDTHYEESRGREVKEHYEVAEGKQHDGADRGAPDYKAALRDLVLDFVKHRAEEGDANMEEILDQCADEAEECLRDWQRVGAMGIQDRRVVWIMCVGGAKYFN